MLGRKIRRAGNNRKRIELLPNEGSYNTLTHEEVRKGVMWADAVNRKKIYLR